MHAKKTLILFIAIAVLFGMQRSGFATNYYVHPSIGDDQNSGSSRKTPRFSGLIDRQQGMMPTPTGTNDVAPRQACRFAAILLPMLAALLGWRGGARQVAP